MKICYFGAYEQQYSRNSINIRGLIENNVEVIECHVNKIKFIKDNLQVRQNISNEGYVLYKSRFTPKRIGKDLILILNQISNT